MKPEMRNLAAITLTTLLCAWPLYSRAMRGPFESG